MTQRLKAHLNGENENPPVKTITTAEFKAVATKTALKYKLTINEVDGLTQAHIHLGESDERGAPVAFLYGPSAPTGNLYKVVLKGVLTADDLIGPLKGKPFSKLLEEIDQGNTYVDVHTRKHPFSAVRGQIETECEKKKDVSV